jgi:SAM-dependent methyltransferase
MMDSMPALLGANAAEYSRPMDLDLEEREFAWTGAKRRAVASLLKTIGPIRIAADIGCRSGREAAFYRDEAGIGEMHGFEIAESALDAARARGLVTHVWVSGEQPCPVADGTFDAITALDVIEHLFDTDIFLQELHRILAPGGHLLIATPNLAWWWNRLRLGAGLAPVGLGGASPTRSFSPAVDLKHLRLNVGSEWLGLFASHGFRNVRTQGYNFPGLLRFPFAPIDNVLTGFSGLAHSNVFLLEKT